MLDNKQPSRLESRAALKPDSRPYKWDVLSRITIGTNRELWLEKRWDAQDSEKPYYILVSVTFAVTDLGKKPMYRDIPETKMLDDDALVALYTGLDDALLNLGLLYAIPETETDEGK